MNCANCLRATWPAATVLLARCVMHELRCMPAAGSPRRATKQHAVMRRTCHTPTLTRCRSCQRAAVQEPGALTFRAGSRATSGLHASTYGTLRRHIPYFISTVCCGFSLRPTAQLSPRAFSTTLRTAPSSTSCDFVAHCLGSPALNCFTSSESISSENIRARRMKTMSHLAVYSASPAFDAPSWCVSLKCMIQFMIATARPPGLAKLRTRHGWPGSPWSRKEATPFPSRSAPHVLWSTPPACMSRDFAFSTLSGA